MESFLTMKPKDIDNEILKNSNKYCLENDYVRGNHWNYPWILTRNWLNIIDKRQKDKNYVLYSQWFWFS
jgi:hypothetical protein